MSIRSLCLSSLLLLALGCQSAPAPEAAAPADPAPVNELRNRYAAMYNSGDVSGLGDLYTDDAVVMNNNQPALKGKAAIVNEAQGMVDQFNVTMSITPTDTTMLSDLAYEYGTYSLSMTPKEGGDPMQAEGGYLVILKRTADGSWRLHREIGNSNQPMPMPAQ